MIFIWNSFAYICITYHLIGLYSYLNILAMLSLCSYLLVYVSIFCFFQTRGKQFCPEFVSNQVKFSPQIFKKISLTFHKIALRKVEGKLTKIFIVA